MVKDKLAVLRPNESDVTNFKSDDTDINEKARVEMPIREREAVTIAHLDGRCVKIHETTNFNVLNRNTLILIANPYEFTLTRTLYHSDRSLEHKFEVAVTGVISYGHLSSEFLKMWLPF